MEVKKKKIGKGYPTYIIAEMSANHGGSKERAKEIIHMAKECGADCIKMQTYTPDTITMNSSNKYFQIYNGTWKGENLYQLYKRAYTPWEWQGELKEEADKIGIDIFSTPFDFTAVDFLEKLGMDSYKIASFELVDIPLIEYVASKGKRMILSTGMATLEEIEEAVEAIKRKNNENFILLRCSSAYPAIPKDMNLKTMQDLSNRFNCLVGLSDHSMGSIAAIAAVAMGACVIEKHVCLSRKTNTADSLFSLEPKELEALVKDIRSTEQAIGHLSYDISEKEKENRIFRKSIFIVQDMKEGEYITKEKIRIIRPGYGMKPKYYNHILGCRVTQDIQAGTPLKEEFIEGYKE